MQSRKDKEEVFFKPFLARDKRSLEEIIAADTASFKGLGLSFEQVAAFLKKMLNSAVAELGRSVIVEGRWEVRAEEARGTIPCPFGDSRWPKDLITVKDLGKGVAISFSSLSLHLLAEHHFLQGKGSSFRLEPEKLKAISE